MRQPKPLHDLARKSAATRTAKAHAEALENSRNAQALAAFEGGFTYAQIAEAMDVSADRVTQVLRRERQRQTRKS